MNNDLEQFSEERLMKLSEYDCAGAEEVCSLARIALAAKQAKPVGYFRQMTCGMYYQLSKSTVAMDQIPLYTTPQPAHTEHEVTIDYLHGHRDGLEWAARTAEASNPLTSDWLYDDPESLAAAIRNGPEMPPPHAEQVKSAVNEFLPENLDRALTIMGVALPESKEEFNFQAERWMQRLINRVIRYESELHAEVNSPEIPDGWKLVPIEPNDYWAEQYCELTNKDPDGEQSTFICDGVVTTTFREKSKREIAAMLAAAPLAAAPKPESE